jgi:hypothetical protein
MSGDPLGRKRTQKNRWPTARVVVADDAVGGVFAIDAGALDWALNGDLAKFYQHARWPGWEAESKALTRAQAIHTWPPLWSNEGKDVASASRKAVPVLELWALQQKFAAERAG